jgi:hypothetical protein
VPTLEDARAAATDRQESGLRWWPDAVLLALGALLVRVPAFFAPTNLGYDDGGYGLAAIAMREGYEPFRDIFSSQGPLFLALVHVADLLGLRTLDAPRLLAVSAGIVSTVAVYAAGSELLDRGRALLAGALTATSGVLLWTTGPITGDGPAAAFATSAVAVALAYRRHPSRGKAVAVGLLIGAAVAVKSLLVGPAILVAWLLVLQRRRVVDVLVVPALAAVLLVLVTIPWGVGNVVHDNVQYHLDKTGDRRPGANAVKLLTTFLRRDAPMLAIGAIGVVAMVVARLRGRAVEPDAAGRPRILDRLLDGTRVLWWWAGLVVVVLLLQDPMFRNHLAALVAPLALLVATIRPSWTLVAVAWAVTLPFQAVQLRPLLVPHDYRGNDAVVAERLRALPDDAWVLSDDPGPVWRVGLATDPFFVDPSELRILPGQDASIAITEDRLVEAAARPRVCAVVVRSDRRFGSFTDLPGRLAELGYEQVERFGGTRGVYVRDCDVR